MSAFVARPVISSKYMHLIGSVFLVTVNIFYVSFHLESICRGSDGLPQSTPGGYTDKSEGLKSADRRAALSRTVFR